MVADAVAQVDFKGYLVLWQSKNAPGTHRSFRWSSRHRSHQNTYLGVFGTGGGHIDVSKAMIHLALGSLLLRGP
jgi:hypothetical protein